MKTLAGILCLSLVFGPFKGFAQSPNSSLNLMGPSRNNTANAQNLPVQVDIQAGTHVKWVADLGSQSYGAPILKDGKIYVGTNNESLKDPRVTNDRGILMAFDEGSGEFLWQFAFRKDYEPKIHDWPLQGIRSTPYVEGDRLYFLNNLTELICADTQGFTDAEDDGIQDAKSGVRDGDMVWKYDLKYELDVFPHNGTVFGGVNRPLILGDLIITGTNTGLDNQHNYVPSPFAPDIIALNKKTGKLVWEKVLAGKNNLHISASNPAYGIVDGIPQLIFPAGDGWIYSLNPSNGEIIWKFDCNPKDAVWKLGGAGTRNNIIATPVIWDNKVYIGVGQDTEHGDAPGHLWCIDMKGKGDVSSKAAVWHRGGNDFNRTVSSVVIDNGIVYAADLSGFLYALDANNGEHYWTYDTFAAVWAGPLVADGKVYLGDEDGDIVVLAAGKKLKELAEYNLGAAIYSAPVAKDNVLYVKTRNKLFALKK